MVQEDFGRVGQIVNSPPYIKALKHLKDTLCEIGQKSGQTIGSRIMTMHCVKPCLLCSSFW
jgi:hypothetical protein